jgi:hypothetical protein
MKVWNNSWYSRDLLEVISYAAPIFINGLTQYFETRSYGNGVNEIFYIEVCQSPIFSINPAGSVLHYGKRKKIVEVGLFLDFEIATNLNKEEFCRYLANKYMERSLDIEELKVPAFDLAAYISDLEAFFKLNSIL